MFHVLRSSAGAGKTHALVKHYLGLCLGSEEAAAYRHVLALTFTNKAAHEMKERAVRYLRSLATGAVPEGALQDVVQHLHEQAGLSGQPLMDRADRMLRHMLHHWSDVSISTIDAFTQRIVRPFARDLQLHHELRMTTDQDGYLHLAVERLIALAGEDPRVTEILGQACLQLLHDEQRWDPERPLAQLSRELLNERSIAPLERIAHLDSSDVGRISATLRAEQKRFREEIQAIGQEALSLLGDAGIGAEDLFQGKRGVHGTFSKLANFDDGPVALNSYARTTLETGRWAGGRITAGAQAALTSIQVRLEALLHQALARLEAGYRDHLLRGSVLRDLPATFALHELEHQLETLKAEDGVAFFSDLTRRVADIVAREPVPFIHERMGERYRHYLIDEFQDTSLLQWTCLLPLIDNALSSGGSALLVGDAKQAIYRWRNGEVRLFTELPRLFGRGDGPMDREREATLIRNYRPLPRLAHNRRSSTTIIAFNNALFGSLAAALPEELRKVYEAHDQLPGRERTGLVEVRLLNGEHTGTERWDEVLGFVDEALQAALEDGARPGDVAILVRTGTQGARVAQHLLSSGRSVISPDGLKVASDLRVGMVIDALRALFLCDAAAAMRALQARALVLKDGHAMVDPFAGRTTAPDALGELRGMVEPLPLVSLLDPLPDLLLYLHDKLLPASDPMAPFLSLLDEAYVRSMTHATDIPAFLEHWERTGAARSTAPPEDGNAVHVMTIHKAKGLEFPVVIVPDVSMRSRGNRSERIWVDPGEAAPEMEAALVAFGSALLKAGVPEIAVEEDLRHLDDLNLLYVAFTRPSERLHAFVRSDANDPVAAGLREWMAARGDGTIYRSGERNKLRTSAPIAPSDPLNRPRPLDDRPPLVLRTAPDRTEGPAIERGKKLHAVLARVTHVGQLEEALRAAEQAGDITDSDRQALLPELSTKLADPRLSPWYGAHLNIRNEATIIDEEGKAWRPDRVVFGTTSVRVLDLKTGVPRPEHHDQVMHYLKLLKGMGHQQVEGTLYYITLDELVPVAIWN
ncbi:MAG: UvrD-helicase domain-containing protein [Flavobacteriales bacterium]